MNSRPTHSARQRALTIFLGASLALILAACSAARTAYNKLDAAYDPVVYVDRSTGCQYLSTGNMYSMTPRLNASGKHICATVQP